MRFPRVLFRFLSLFLLAAGLSAAQDIDSTNQTVQVSTPIQHNSFLIEEAYNQEDGVIQQISTFARLTNSGDWVYTQTDEGRCEATSTRECVAGSHPNVVRFTGSGWGARPSNYRSQLVGGGETKLEVAPRLSDLFFVLCRRPRFWARIRRPRPPDQTAHQHPAFGPSGVALDRHDNLDSARAR
jgi:hypothetical protein